MERRQPPASSLEDGEAASEAEALAVKTGNSLDRLLPGDIILDSYSPDVEFQEQRDTYGAAFTHVTLYVGVEDGKHMVVEAVRPGGRSRKVAIEDKRFTNYKVVRVTRASDSERHMTAELAASTYVDVPYAWDQLDEPIPSPEQMLLMRSGLDKRRTDRLYCSSLVWNAWLYGGNVDLDSDYVSTWGTKSNLFAMPRSYFIMPDDIAMSDKIEYLVGVSLPALVEVPAVVGMPESEAKERLIKAGFTVTTTRKSNRATKGTVITQRPIGGQRIDSASVVGITVSKGPAAVQAPTVGEVEAAIKRIVSEHNAEVRIGRVRNVKMVLDSRGRWWASGTAEPEELHRWDFVQVYTFKDDTTWRLHVLGTAVAPGSLPKDVRRLLQ